jgi:hypothetical protein
MSEFRCMICDSPDTEIVTWGRTNEPTSEAHTRENMVNSNLVEAWYMNNSYCAAEGEWRPLYETDVGDREYWAKVEYNESWENLEKDPRWNRPRT